MGLCYGCATSSAPVPSNRYQAIAGARNEPQPRQEASGDSPALDEQPSVSVPSSRSPDPDAASDAAASNPPPGVRYKVTVAGYIASPSEELLSKAISYASAQDKLAFGKMMASGLVIELKAGMKVQLVDTKFLSGLVKIRPYGSTIELWVPMEAVKDPS